MFTTEHWCKTLACHSIAGWRKAELLHQSVGSKTGRKRAEIFRARGLNHHPVFENIATFADPVTQVCGVESVLCQFRPQCRLIEHTAAVERNAETRIVLRPHARL